MRKELKHEISRARENYLKNSLSNLSYGTQIWSKLKHLGLVKRTTSSPLNHFEPSDLNEHFAAMVRRHPACDQQFVNSLFQLHKSKVNSSFTWTEIDIVDVTKALHLTLQKSKGNSPDGLDLRWLKNHVPQITIFLTALFNRSLDTGVFPHTWKAIFIIPINKYDLKLYCMFSFVKDVVNT
ncbi:Protein of unknown function [Cotesia congregata]|uniref:Uncharacterized protein n=1 Tax=Cotesia congregata TaxID=51543 RepID=A0A8J2ML91_COTCN|nr:Protein of unknown function [Cotesia congregata]